MLGQQTDLLDDLLHLLNTVFLVLKELEVVQTLGNDVVNGSTLVQRSSRILEHHLDVTDDLPVQRAAGLTGNTDALILDLTSGTGIDTDYGTADGGLTGAGLTDQREGLALINVKACILNGLHRVIALAEGDVHILQAQQDLTAVFIQRTMLRQMLHILSCHYKILLP